MYGAKKNINKNVANETRREKLGRRREVAEKLLNGIVTQKMTEKQKDALD